MVLPDFNGAPYLPPYKCGAQQHIQTAASHSQPAADSSTDRDRDNTQQAGDRGSVTPRVRPVQVTDTDCPRCDNRPWGVDVHGAWVHCCYK